MKKHNMQTELAKVRGLGSGKSGTHHFIAQRLSAIGLIPLFIFMIYLVVRLIGADYYDAVALISHPFHALMLILFLMASLYHAQLGLQVVIEDYVHSHFSRILLILLVKLLAVLLAAIAIFAILRIAL